MCPERQTPPRQQARPRPHAARGSRGFTLLEVIVIVIVSGLLAALVVNLMGTQLLRSSNPSTIAADAGDAETAMEAVVAFYTTNVNNNTATALDAVKGEYPASNSTASHVTINDVASWDSSGIRALIVTATVGKTSYTTLLTQARTNALDNATNF
ncbi:MAG: hypothetical protein A2051_03555 [Desulfovibrionales bacterium GWA2_65_9]|nr:MAG: hypothetical protein A2051_03555 [Desulfovibrionales bacterium GWA2_65_9]